MGCGVSAPFNKDQRVTKGYEVQPDTETIAPPAPDDDIVHDGRPGDALRAPSIYHLQTDFMKQVDAKVQAKEVVETPTIRDIEPVIIRPMGKDITCPRDTYKGAAYVDCIHGDEHVGLATHMLSYTWGYTCIDIVKALEQYCLETPSASPKNMYVWICCFCINQWRVQQQQQVQFDVFRRAFGDRVVKIGTVLALMAPWQKPNYLTRVWCVFEMFTALDNDVPVKILMPPEQRHQLCESLMEKAGSELQAIWETLSQIKVEKAEAFYEHDRQCILELIGSSPDNFNKVNTAVRERIRAWFESACVHQLSILLPDESIKAEKRAQACRGVGYLLFYLDKFESAIKVQQQGIELMTKAGFRDHEIIADILKGVGVSKLESDTDPDGALENLIQSFNMRQRLGTLKSDKGARLLMWLGVAKVRRGDWASGLASLQEARSIRETQNSLESPEGAQLLMHLSAVQALMEYQKAYQIFVKKDHRLTPKCAQLVGRMGNVKLFCRDFEGAKASFDELVYICNELGDKRNADAAIAMSAKATQRCSLSYVG